VKNTFKGAFWNTNKGGKGQGCEEQQQGQKEKPDTKL